MTGAGNRAVFENDEQDDNFGGYVQNRVTGSRIPIIKQGGTYKVSLWTEQNEKSRFESVNQFSDLNAVPEVPEEDELVIEGEFSQSSGLTGPAK